MAYYAVIDTNVLLSALLSKNSEAATVRVIDAVFKGIIIPLYHQDVMKEYEEVLNRDKFHLEVNLVNTVINAIAKLGIEVFPQPTGEILIDPDDLIFYEIVLEKRKDDAYLVTGNQKHYPSKNFIVTPAEMMDIVDGNTNLKLSHPI